MHCLRTQTCNRNAPIQGINSTKFKTVAKGMGTILQESNPGVSVVPVMFSLGRVDVCYIILYVIFQENSFIYKQVVPCLRSPSWSRMNCTRIAAS